MLQHLELADGLTELLTLLGVVDRVFVQHFHHADCFASNRESAFIV